MKIDMHLHSNYSDGSFSPYALVDEAKKIGLDVISLTDHDTINGVVIAMAYGEEKAIKVLSGVEISAYSSTEIHILGYNFDVQNSQLSNQLNTFMLQRQQRVEKIFDRLEEFNIFLDRESVKNIQSVGRVHVAKLLVNSGHCATTNEAFDKYLGASGIAYLPSKRISSEEAVRMIVEAGGIAVIAHPQRLLASEKLIPQIEQLIPYGLGGIEVYYPSHDESTSKQLLDIAKKYKLIATGGSDYHGEIRNVNMGDVDFYMEKFTRKRLKL